MAYNNRKYVYVVEGNTDEDKLKKLGVTYIVKTGGKFIRNDILLFLKKVHEVREIVLLTDPDGPGKQIAETVKKYVGSCIVVQADKKKAIYHEKVGIAEMKLQDLQELLQEYLTHDNQIQEDNPITQEDMIDLALIGSSGKKKRMTLIEKYHMPFTSAKNVLTAINMLGLTLEELKEETTI